MTYYLRKSNRSKGIYLQMYDRYWDSDRNSADRNISGPLVMSMI